MILEFAFLAFALIVIVSINVFFEHLDRKEKDSIEFEKNDDR